MTREQRNKNAWLWRYRDSLQETETLITSMGRYEIQLTQIADGGLVAPEAVPDLIHFRIEECKRKLLALEQIRKEIADKIDNVEDEPSRNILKSVIIDGNTISSLANGDSRDGYCIWAKALNALTTN